VVVGCLVLIAFSIGCEAQRPALLDCAIKSDTSTKQANVEIYIFSDRGYELRAVNREFRANFISFAIEIYSMISNLLMAHCSRLIAHHLLKTIKKCT